MKIKIELDGLTLEQANGLTNFLSSLKNEAGKLDTLAVKEVTEDIIDSEAAAVKEEKPKATRKKAEKETFATTETLKESITPEPEEVEAIEVVEPETVSAPKITVASLRLLVSAKIAKDREVIKSIKEKLTELGADNISTLKETHFESFNTFLATI